MKRKVLYKQILIISGKILFLAFALISMAFVNHTLKNKQVQQVIIRIHSNNNPNMCSTNDIKKYIAKNKYELNHQSYSAINFYQLEKVLSEKNEVKKADVFFTPNEELYIDITERQPIARIITPRINHYIDDEWKIFKAVNSYKVPLVLGDIYDNPEPFKHYSIRHIHKSKLLTDVSSLDDIYQALKVITADSVLLNFIDYLYINAQREITLYPVIGKFLIQVGTSDHFLGKMNKLKLFITNGLNKNDGWNKYTTINISYKNLIYCTKK